MVIKTLFSFEIIFMQGKKVVLSFTTGVPESFYKETGPHGDMNVVLWTLQVRSKKNPIRFRQ
jgi:putative NADPH-quinone reductase